MFLEGGVEYKWLEEYWAGVTDPPPTPKLSNLQFHHICLQWSSQFHIANFQMDPMKNKSVVIENWLSQSIVVNGRKLLKMAFFKKNLKWAEMTSAGAKVHPDQVPRWWRKYLDRNVTKTEPLYCGGQWEMKIFQAL